jgi:diguanylate cyclase (GGDEF)-like protein/PAS domain S-box-containing protein
MAPVPYEIRDIALLFVEDEPVARSTLSRMLARNYPGLWLHVAEDGVAGLALFRENRPGIVVTDINMPGMNGIQMAREIKKIEPEVVIVAVTANNDTSCLLSAIEIGIHHYVLKPVNYSELFGVIDKILEKIILRRLVSEQVEKIRRREQQLSEAQKITHLGSWEWDVATGRGGWSDEMYRICGLEPEEIPASFQAFMERVHPGDREALEKLVQQAFTDHQPVVSQYFRLLHPDGSTRIIRGQLEAIFDHSGQPVSVIGTCHDVTELKGAEAAQRASEQRFFKIFQATPDLLSITGVADGCYLEVNEAFLRELGYLRPEVIGRPAQELGVWVDDRERVGVAQALEDLGELRDLEVHFKTKPGREITGLMAAEYIEISGNKCILTLFKDISERKRIEEERACLASIVESSDDAIMVSDPDGIITIWNAGAEKLFGYSAQEIKGKHISTLGPADYKDEMVQMYQRDRNDEQIMHFDAVRIRKDGRQINISLTLSPLKDAEGMIAGISGIARDVTKRTEMDEIIKHQAQHDTLTDLPNRKLFMDFLALELAQARRNRKNLAVLFLDLDHFKQINDTLGHAAGDLLLQAVAQRLKGCVRESDTVARIGGDEFNVLMTDLNQADDVGIAVGKILGAFESPFLLDNVEVSATTSIGVSMFPADGISSEDLVQKADSAMYFAKQRSGNAYQFYNDEINARTVKRREMERLLRLAVQRRELELVFQPQVRIDTGRIVGVEALLRWRHPENGLLLPAQFLNIAEETGAIVPLGEWAIRTACAQMKEWQGKGYDFGVTVNLSNRQFHQSDLIEMTSNVLAETGLDPQALELDVTENTIMDDLDLSSRTMRKLTQLGVKFSVDDFGIGSSSLSWIKKLPIARVKIDRSFIQDILTEPNDLAVVSAVISMSHNLSMKVNAVGVESQEQLALIQNNGGDEAQGYLISKPIPAFEFEKLVANMS